MSQNSGAISGSGGVTFGIAYYPEQWDRSYWESDAKRIAAMGIRAARMMEFAWTIVEPQEGKYDFSLFDEMIDIFARNGVKTVLGTPTAGVPAWLFEKDPEMIQVLSNGMPKTFGIRRNICFNAETYLEASRKLVEAVAVHFASSPHIIGWQVDNEIGHDGSDRCYCANCCKKWHHWLKARYGSIDVLNKTWGTVFWSNTYQHFRQVPVPREQFLPHNPGLVLDYDRFCSDSIVNFVHEQVAILRAHSLPTQWISTNISSIPHAAVLDSEKMLEVMDFAGVTNYPVWGDMDEPNPYYYASYLLSYLRGLKNTGKFTIFEQFAAIQGHRVLGHLPNEQQGVLWTNQSIARGADSVYYFRWRTAPNGQEQLCSGLLDHDNQDTSRRKALEENLRANECNYSRFANQPVESSACLLYDKDNSRVIKEQYLSRGLQFAPITGIQIGYDVELAKTFAPFVIFNVNADIKSVRSVELEKYKLISLPLYQMADPQFAGRLAAWVENGGHLILGFRAGARDLNNWAVPLELPGVFAKMAGVSIRQFEALNKTRVKIRLGWLPIPAEGEAWADLLQPITAKPLAWYVDRKKHYRGTPCITVNSYGKGKVYTIGTSLSPTAIFLFYRKALKDAGLSPRFYGMGIEVVSRNTSDGKTIDVILNHTNKTKHIKGTAIPPYGMKIV
jgi:beta-galactosidase